MRELYLISLIFVLIFHVQSQYLNIGALMTIGDIEREENVDYDGSFEEEGKTAIAGWRFWETLCNEKGGIVINGDVYFVNVTMINVGATAEKVQRVTNETCNGVYGDFDLLFAPWSSGLTEAAAMAAYPYDIAMFAGWASSESVFRCPDEGWEDVYPCTARSSRRFPALWSILSDNGDTFDSVLNILKLKGANNILTWTSNTLYTKAVISGTEQLAINSGIELLGSMIVNAIPTEEDIDNILDLIEFHEPEIIAGASRYVEGCTMFLEKLKERNLHADAILLNDCHTDIEERLYVIDFTEYHTAQRGSGFEDTLYFPPTEEKTSSEIFRDEYIKFSGINDPILQRGVPNAFNIGELVEIAYSRSTSKNLEDIKLIIPFIKETTFWNGLEFSSTGMNEGMIRSLIQHDLDGETKIISPLGTSNLDIIYPFPIWNDRYQAEGYFARIPDIVIFVVTCVLMVFSLIMILMVATHLDYPSITAATPSFIILTLVGSLLMYAGVICWMMWMNTFMCIAKNIFLGVGIVLLFATLVAKTHRIKKIFIFSSIVVKTVSEFQLLGLIAILVGIELLIHIVWVAISTPTAVYVIIDPYRPVLNYYTCSYNDLDFIFIIIQVVYKGILVLYSLYLSTILWKYQKSIYVESREIVFCIYNLTIFGGIFAAIQISLEGTESRALLFVLRSACILFSSVITVVTLSTTKLWKKETGKNFDFSTARSKKSRYSKNSKNSYKSEGTQTMSGGVTATEYQQVRREKRALQKKYNKLKSTIIELKEEFDFSLSMSD